MDTDQTLMTLANNMIMLFHDRKFAGEHELLLYKQACDLLTARFRAATGMYNKIAEDYENGQDPNSS